MMKNNTQLKFNQSSVIYKVTHAKEFLVTIGLILLCLIVSLLSPYFLNSQNIFNVLRQISIISILAVGQALVIITGGIDLSVGYVLGLCGVMTAILGKAGISPILIFFAVILLGSCISAISGLLITKVNINPFIATLGISNICRGVSLLITGGMAIQFKNSISVIGYGYIGDMPIPALIMFIVVALGVLFTRQTQPGRNVFAVGSNIRAAQLSGINVDNVRIMVYVITGALCGLGGLISSGTLQSAEPTAGAGYELDAIAAVVIGGTSMSGGEGTILGVLIGSAIMGVLKNSFVLLQISAYWQVVVLGIVIIAAVAADSIKTKNANK